MRTRWWLAGSVWAHSALWGQVAHPPEEAPAPLPVLEPRVWQGQAEGPAVRRVILLPHFSTTIRMRDTVQSIVVGDKSLFQADHDEDDPSLVVVKVLTEHPAQTNLEITTVTGQQVVLWLVSETKAQNPVDLALRFDQPPASPRSIWRPESGQPHVLVEETVPLSKPAVPTPEAGPSVLPAAVTTVSTQTGFETKLSELLSRQEQAPLPALYSQHPGPIRHHGRLQAGVSEVIDGGGTVFVLFAVVNSSPQAVALLPPQVQLGGGIGKRWTTADQLPVLTYRLDRERLEPGGRANGVVVFLRPSFKQSRESLYLQMAESGAVDQPALAPIGFGVSREKGGVLRAGDAAR